MGGQGGRSGRKTAFLSNVTTSLSGEIGVFTLDPKKRGSRRDRVSQITDTAETMRDGRRGWKS